MQAWIIGSGESIHVPQALWFAYGTHIEQAGLNFSEVRNIASSMKVFCRIYNVPEVRKSNANIGLSGRRNLTHKCDLIKRSGAES